MRFVANVCNSYCNQGSEGLISKLFSVAVTSAHIWQVMFQYFAAKYGSIVIAVSLVTATCLLKVNFSW